MSAARLLTVSAEDADALDATSTRLGEALADGSARSIDEVADALAARPALPHRLALVAASVQEAATILLAGPDGNSVRGVAADKPPVVFLYPGVGDHCPGMVAGLYEAVPAFRAAFDTCATLAESATGLDFHTTLATPSGPESPRPTSVLDPAPRPGWLDEPAASQLAIFVVEYAMTRTLQHLGLEPDALLGYSIGEYVAAAVAGVARLDQIVPLVARRAELIETTPPGGMLAVLLAPDEVAPYLDELTDPNLVIAALDSPGLCVVSGPAATVAELERRLTDAVIATRRLPVRHAFHSPLLAGIEAPLTELVDAYSFRAPAIPVLSNVTGGWLTADEASRGAYWARHLSQPVRFMDDLGEMWRLGAPTLVEVGPGRMLGSLARAHPAHVPGSAILSTLPTPADAGSAVPALLTTIGRAWTQGLPVDVGTVRV